MQCLTEQKRLGLLEESSNNNRLEHGVSFAAPDEDAFSLSSSVPGQIKDATVRGYQKVLRSTLGYASASRAAGGSPKAFEDAMKFLVANMIRSISKKLEIEMFYGQSGYGTVASVAANVVTVTTAQWAPGIWAGAEKMPVEFRDVTGATLRGSANVTAVDLDARTITVDSLPAGVIATDVIWHKGAYGKESPGAHRIITNTSELFGIDATAYNLWKGNSYPAGGALSFDILLQAISRGVEKGLEGTVHVFVNPRAWSSLLSEQVALRRYDVKYNTKELQNGAESISFYGQNGGIEIHPSIYVKESHAFILFLDDFNRIGSTDLTFRRPGQGDEFFRDVENAAAYELRCYTDQSLFTHSPGKNILVTGIVNP